jgi:hypothetical protein
MLSDKLKQLFKRLNPGARCWYDSNKLVQSGISGHAVSYTR